MRVEVGEGEEGEGEVLCAEVPRKLSQKKENSQRSGALPRPVRI